MRSFIKLLEHRTGFKSLLHEALYENIPCGARFRYVTGSMLVFAFVTQVVTGIFLWMAYSPSSQTAWESVYYIQYHMTGGWLLRGVHHFMAQAMIVVMGLHLLQVIVDGAYRAPREVNYWLGIILMQIVLGLGLTGYLLPWDQKGYWATNVATNLMTLVPFVGAELQKVVLGGGEYGHHTLTRFFALHAGVLPALLVVFLGLHVMLFRRHGITAKISAGRRDDFFWPRQVLFDAIGCSVMLVVVLLLTVHFDVMGLASANLPVESKGAELGAPADPSEQYSAARPEWYFLFLFQLLKYFESEFIGAIVIPGAIMTVLALAPIIGIWKAGHWMNVTFVFALLLGAGVLTGLAIMEDRDKPEFTEAVHDAEQEAARIKELIMRRPINEDGELDEPLMMQVEGAVYLLRNDPLTQGPKLFEKHCSSCHAYTHPKADQRMVVYKEPKTHPLDEEKGEKEADKRVVRENGEVVYEGHGLTGPNLYDFASREWIKGLLDPNQIVHFEYGEAKKSPEYKDNAEHPAHFRQEIIAPYFGNTAHREGRMAGWVKEHLGNDDEEKNLAAADVEAIVAALSAQAQLHSQAEQDAKDTALIQKGIGLIQHTCAGHCHKFGDAGQWGLAPDLTGYGSYQWMMGLISDPTHERFYRGENDRMPSFAKSIASPEKNTVSQRELSLIVDWLRGEYYRKSDEKKKKTILPHSEEQARRAVELARALPVELDPAPTLVGTTQDKAAAEQRRAERLFRLNCAGCHSHVDAQGNGIVSNNATAPNLHRFASREWLSGLLDPAQVDGPGYFGNTSHFEGEMSTFVSDSFAEADDETKELRRKLIIALSAEAQLPAQSEADMQAQDDGVIDAGREAFEESFDGGSCIDCHKMGEAGELQEGYPDLTGYGSLSWLVGMISDPENEHYYISNNDRMPAFGADPNEGNRRPLLSPEEITLIARWLRGEDLSKPAGNN